jgi:hypothetical protein
MTCSEKKWETVTKQQSTQALTLCGNSKDEISAKISYQSKGRQILFTTPNWTIQLSSRFFFAGGLPTGYFYLAGLPANQSFNSVELAV